MKKFILKITLFLLIPVVSFSQLNYVDTYIEWIDSVDLLYIENPQQTCITANLAVPSGLDYITGHTARIDVYAGVNGSDIIDEAITLSKIYVNGENEAIDLIENIFVDIHTPDEISATLINNNHELLYDLKVDNGGFLIGTGVYYELATCKGSNGPGGPIGGSPTSNFSLPYPFYFKYDLDLDAFVYFKRLIRPNGSCDVNPLDGKPVDIEVLNNNEYVICMAEGVDRGLVKVRASDGVLLGVRKYNYIGNKTFDPIDIEVTSDRIFAVGKVNFGFPAVYRPALLSTKHNLSSARMRYYNVSASTSSNEFIKMSGVRYNPESNSLLLAGWVFDGVGSLVAIHVNNLNNLNHEWMHLIDLNVPNAISTFSNSYGLEYMYGKGKFALHADGIENYGTDGTGDGIYNYLLEIGSQENQPIEIKRLDFNFHGDDRNEIVANNTLVQSPRSDYLGMVLHRHFDSDPYTPIGFLNSNPDLISDNEYGCLSLIPPVVETPKSYSYLMKHSTSSIKAFSEHKALVQVLELYPETDIQCQGIKQHSLKQSIATTRNNNSNEFHIYPNPASDQIYLTIEDDYTIFDLNGRKCKRVKATNEIDLTGLKNGLYVIVSSKGQAEKLVIQD